MQELHATALEIRILMSMITKLAGRDLEQRMLTQGLPVSMLQHGIMRLVAQHPYTISELSRQMMLAPATLVQAVDALERNGLLTRGHDPVDRRRTPLQLTEQGRILLGRVPAVDESDVMVTSLQSLAQADIQQLRDLLRRLVNHMTGDTSVAHDLEQNIRREV